jgi:chemotaxis protein methyltransferase CheR
MSEFSVYKTQFSIILKRRSGFFLTFDKAYLLQSRLLPVARKYGFATIEELAQSVRTSSKEVMLADITAAMTTNESSFFRDQRPFNQFRQLHLPTLLKTRAAKKRIRI